MQQAMNRVEVICGIRRAAEAPTGDRPRVDAATAAAIDAAVAAAVNPAVAAAVTPAVAAAVDPTIRAAVAASPAIAAAAVTLAVNRGIAAAINPAITAARERMRVEMTTEVGRCRLTPCFRSWPHASFQRLKLKHDKPLSGFAFNCNLRH